MEPVPKMRTRGGDVMVVLVLVSIVGSVEVSLGHGRNLRSECFSKRDYRYHFRDITGNKPDIRMLGADESGAETENGR